jgi:LacI family transcriptional regulator
MAAKKSKPTLAVIARSCGVSKMTVSRVLRNDPNVAEATRNLVLSRAEKTGFLPSGTRHLAGDKSTGDYCILFQPEYSKKDAFFSGIILSVQQELFDRGFGCSVGVIKNEYSEFLKLNRILCARHVRGILVVGEIPTQYAATLQENLLNVVYIDYPGDSALGSPYNAICVDNAFGSHLALRHLIKLGRGRILLICGKAGHYFTNDLIRAYEATMAQHNLGIDPSLILYADFHTKGGFDAVKSALETGIRFDAVFSNDEMACGAIQALKQAGYAVPKDVAVVGFDGLPIGEIISPALTTVIVDREKMSRLAVTRLLEIDHETGGEGAFEKVSIFPRLLVRESCGGTAAIPV